MPFRDDKIIYLDGKPPAVVALYMKNPQRPLMTLKELQKSLKP
jgi:hypothetical protein